MILHRQGTQPRLIDSSEHSSINLNLRKSNSIYNIGVVRCLCTLTAGLKVPLDLVKVQLLAAAYGDAP